jgi:CRP-like cAMP-binding protein
MSDAITVAVLRTVALFSEVSESDLQTLTRSSRSLTRVQGARIFEEGSSADSCFVVVAGLAKVVITGRRGSEITLDVVGERELVGELALLDRSPRSASLVATHECRMIQLNGASFLALRSNPLFEQRLVTHVTTMLRRSTAQLRAVHTLSSSEHVRWCLARLAERLGRRSGNTTVISPRPRHQDIADMTGSTRETVSRIMRRLEASKAISWNPTSLTLDERAFKGLLGSDGF